MELRFFRSHLFTATAFTASVIFGQGGTALVPQNLEGLMVAGLGGKGSLVATDGRPFTKALRIVVAEKPKNHWDVQAVVKSTAPVPAGSIVAFWFAARAPSGEGKMLVTLKDKAGKGVFREEIPVGRDWAEKRLSGTLESEAQKGDLSLIVTFGWQKQELELGGLALLSLPPGTRMDSVARPEPPVGGPSAAAPPAPPSEKPGPSSGPFVPEELPPLPEGKRRFAIFKWDDLKAQGKDVPAPFQRVADFAAAHQMHVSLGIICTSFEPKNAGFNEWIRKWAIQNGGPIEFWLHGYDHMMTQTNGKPYTEFNGPDYETQKRHFQRAMDLMKENTGISFVSFGSAGNQYDATAFKVLGEFPEIKVWLFGEPKAKLPVFSIPRLVEGERGAGRPDYAYFMKGYREKRTAEALLIQGHPAMWDDARFEEFVKIHGQLARDGWEFVTPWEYFKYRNP